jgi:hypothetical protein
MGKRYNGWAAIEESATGIDGTGRQRALLKQIDKSAVWPDHGRTYFFEAAAMLKCGRAEFRLKWWR